MPIHDPAARLLIIGLDGGTWDVFGPLCDLGEMPNLARLRSQGAWSNLWSTQPPFTAPAWASFLTGVNPGRHGILQFLCKPADPAASLRGEGVPINASNLRVPTIWDYFNAAGKAVGVINVPLSYPLRPMDGFGISGMLTPPSATDWTYPPELAASLDGYIIDLDYGRPGQSLAPGHLPAPAVMLSDIAHMTERRGYHTLRLMQENDWDALMVVFTGTDRIFHHFWQYLQTREAEPQSLEFAVSEQLAGYFHLLDNILGSLARSAGKDANVVFVSDHGFGPAARHWAHLNNWLLEIEALHLHAVSPGGWLQRVRRRAPWLRDVAKRILPPEARAAVQERGHLADAIDWADTQAWAEPLYNNVGGVYLHRADRYADGAVSPAASDRLCQRLIDEAQHLRIPGTNRPLVTDIQRREDVYNGSHASSFPDLIVTLDPDYVVVPTLGTSLITPIQRLLRSGDHRPDGIFLVCGPNIKPGFLPGTPDLIDMAPTLLHLADLPTPVEMEGQVVSSAFTEGYLVLHPPRRGPVLPPPAPAEALGADEATAVTDHLRSLGYL